MRKQLYFALLAVSAASSAAFAQSATTDETMTSTTVEEKRGTGTLRDEVVGIKPLVGVLAYDDGTGSNTARGAAGLQVDMNFASNLRPEARALYLGIQTGAIYSHTGGAGASFFGGGSGVDSGNLLLLPANLKIGYNLGDIARVSAHGGGNFIYRSVIGAVPTGDEGFLGSNNWGLLPNVGGEVEFGLAPNISLSLRPDWTIAPGNDIFTGSLALGIALG